MAALGTTLGGLKSLFGHFEQDTKNIGQNFSDALKTTVEQMQYGKEVARDQHGIDDKFQRKGAQRPANCCF